jgi:hypothetical protein
MSCGVNVLSCGVNVMYCGVNTVHRSSNPNPTKNRRWNSGVPECWYI